jgi:hypothetical protein
MGLVGRALEDERPEETLIRSAGRVHRPLTGDMLDEPRHALEGVEMKTEYLRFVGVLRPLFVLSLSAVLRAPIEVRDLPERISSLPGGVRRVLGQRKLDRPT